MSSISSFPSLKSNIFWITARTSSFLNIVILSEQFRQPDEHIGYIFGYLSVGSALSVMMIILGILFLSRFILNEKTK